MSTHGSTGHHDGHHGPNSFLTRYVFSTDHKVIGIQFMFASLLFVILGGLLALGVRYQIAWPNQHVPYAKILPGKMTNEAPEANLALWKLGCEVELRGDTTSDGRTFVAGTKAKLVEFPEGLAVTLPVGTRVKNDSGRVWTIEQSTPAMIAWQSVHGDYDYAKQQAQTVAGMAVTVPASDGLPQRELTLVGVEKTFTGSAGGVLKETVSGPILLPINAATTPVLLEIDGANARMNADTVTFSKQALTSDGYLQLFTMHASIMIFFVIIPMLVGAFGNFLIPLMIGARDMAFPKLNMLAFWISAPAGLLMLISFWTPGGAAGGGWTMYPPLSNATYTSQLGTTLWIASVGLIGFGSIVGALNYITTTINMRAPGMTMFRMPLTVWSLLITSMLALFATPMLTAAMVLLLLDRTMGTHFFAPAGGGQPLLFQHLFWFYSHPAVYIMILPAMGVTSDILATYARKPIFGYKPMIYAMAAITGLGFIVWGHHMFQSGMNPVMGTTFMASTIMIAVPSAIKTFNWLGTLWGGNIRFTPAMLNALGFVSMFVIGGLSGIFMASAPVDIQIHDTYFIVAHIHYVLFGGSLFGIYAGVYHWFPKMFGRQMNQKWGVIHFVMTILAFNGTFFLMHILGIGGHPRRYASIMEYPTLVHLQPLNVFMTICAMMMGMAQLPFFYNVFRSLPRGLGRAVAAAFVVMLGLPAVIGMSYWGLFESSLLGGLFNMSEAGYTSGQTYLSHGLLLVALVGLALVMLKQLPTGGRIATVVCFAPVVAFCLWLMAQGSAESVAYYEKAAQQATDDGRAFAAWWAGSIPVWHNIQIAIGLGLIYIAASIGGVWLIWFAGGRIGMPVILEKLLYVVFLPAFLAPLILKKDPYLWMGNLWPGFVELYPETMVQVVIALTLCAVPGIVYLVLWRPNDAFGYEPGVNPCEANSLEWTTPSPPPHLNFDEIPTVYRGPYEYGSPVVEKDYLPQVFMLPAGVVEPAGH